MLTAEDLNSRSTFALCNSEKLTSLIWLELITCKTKIILNPTCKTAQKSKLNKVTLNFSQNGIGMKIIKD